MDPIFDEYCRSVGKMPVDPDDLKDRNPVIGYVAATFEIWVQRCKAQFPKIPKLCAGLIEDTSFGAAADIWEDAGVIRLHSSVPTILANLIAVVLSHPNSMQSDYVEIVELSPFGFRSSEGRLLEELFNNGQLFNVSPAIAQRALPMAVALCNFAFFHEFVHIRNGHVDLFKRSVGLTAMEETESRTSESLSLLDRQAMEWEADKVAHGISTDVALSTILGRPFVGCPMDEIRQAFWTYHLGLYLLFKIFELAEPRKIAHRVHPTPIVRMSFLLESVLRLSQVLKIEPPLAGDFQLRLVKSGETAWAMITGAKVASVSRWAEAMQAQLGDCEAVLKQWNELRERLAPYNRGTSELSRPNLV